ncbi:MAG TPA: flagellar motor protein MotB [Sphingobium sp.]|nr:flagellar motor protein MotB [Sphingobium sp.]
MASAPNKKRANEPEPRPIIVKKIITDGHGGHHGGAWKVAYADFVTAMMAFFLLMWLLGATTEKQRKGLADYFTPTLINTKESSAGSAGMFGGDAMLGKENYPTTGGQGNLAITIPRDATGTKDVGGKDLKNRDREKFEQLKRTIEQRLEGQKALRHLKRNIRFTETMEGLRIDLIDEADFAMFASATDRLLPEARTLVAQVAQVIAGVPNQIIVRGHTDGLPYGAGRSMNNWLLSSARAEATRVELARAGVASNRFARIEGLADREPFVAGDPYDPRNRRMSILLAWSKGLDGRIGQGAGAEGETPEERARIHAAILARDNPRAKMQEIARRADMGGTSLPDGAVISNADAIPKRNALTPPGKTAATDKSGR